MRYFMTIIPSPDYEAGKPVPQGIMDAMGPYIEKTIATGALISTAGLKRSSSGVRLMCARVTLPLMVWVQSAVALAHTLDLRPLIIAGFAKPIATWKQPYRLFERGESKWVRIELPPTRVPPGAECFFVALDFHPTASQGVYVSFDESARGTDRAGSLVATPGKKGGAFASGDWMIRAELDRPKAADALE